jgi:hypothetical protein
MSPVPRLKVPRMKPSTGQTPLRQICSRDSIGFGYEFPLASICSTYNCARLTQRVQQSLTSFEASATAACAATGVERDNKFDFGR